MALEALPPQPGLGRTAELHLEDVQRAADVERQEPRPQRVLPAEWAPQSAVQLTWPHADTDWHYMLAEVTDTFVRLAYEIAVRQPLLIVTPEPDKVQTLLSRRLPAAVLQNVHFFAAPTDDTWARDHGFLTVLSDNGAELLNFRFNGWGGKFAADRDNAINRRLFDTGWFRGHYVSVLDFELEGGAIESDGAGTLLTTAACLLNANRRNADDMVPTPDREQVEMLLRERLGAERVLWLNHGYLAGDDTDSHIDTLARLCPNQTIVYVKCDDPADEHYAELQAMEAELQAFRTADDRPYRLIPVPMPDAVHDEDGERLPATYANFLIMDRAVLLPTYAQPDHDETARRALQKAFPHHEIVGVDCRSLIRQHGSLHCVTMQYPRGVVRFD